MEVQDVEGRARLGIKVPNYWQQVPDGLECQKDVQVGAARVTLNIKLDLFAEQKKYRQILTQKSRFDGRSHRANEWSSPRSKQSSPGAQKQALSKKTPSFNSPDAKALKYNEHISSAAKNFSGSPGSPRIKKSALQGLYTKGGIEEIIHGDSQWDAKNSSIHTNQNKAVTSRKNLVEDEGTDADNDHLDVGIVVECTRTNIPLPLLRHLKVTSGIGERPEQLRTLVYDDDYCDAEQCRVWRGLLVPRVSVRSYDLLDDEALVAWLEIGFPAEVLSSCQPSLLTLSRDLRVMLETHDASSDASLITTDGGKLPAHLSILRARSNLLSSCKILSQTNCDIGLMVDGRSPTLNKPPTLQLAACAESQTSDSGVFFETDNREKSSERRHRFNSPNGSSGKGISNAGKSTPHDYRRTPKKVDKSPFKKPTAIKPPQKLTSSDRLALFSKHYDFVKTPLKENKENIWLSSLLDEDSQFLDDEKPAKDLNQCFIECNDTKDSSITSTMDAQRNNEEDGTLLEFRENFSRLDLQSKSPSKHASKNSITHKDGCVLIQANMSTSVAKQFLEWVYTGECSDLPVLCRPLLLAGRRHGVPQLAAAAERHLAQQLDVDNAPDLLQLAHTQQASHLLQRALRLVRQRGAEVTDSPAWERVISRCPQLGVLVTRSVCTGHS